MCSTVGDGRSAPARRARRLPPRPTGGADAGAGQAAARPGAPDAGAAPGGGRAARRRVGHLVHVAGAGPPDQRLAPTCCARSGGRCASTRPGSEHLVSLAQPVGRRRCGRRHARRGAVVAAAADRGASNRRRPTSSGRTGSSPAWNAAQARLYPPIERARRHRAQPDVGAVRPPGRARADRRLGHPRPPGAGRVPRRHHRRSPRPGDDGARRPAVGAAATSSARGGRSTTWPGSRPACAGSTTPAPAC